MRSGRKEFLLAGLCVGALSAMLVTVSHLPDHNASQPAPMAASSASSTSGSDTASSTSAEAPSAAPQGEPGTPSLMNESVDPAKLAALAPHTNLSVTVYDREEQKLTTNYRPTSKFTSASLVKVFIALEAVEENVESATVKEMLAKSDDNTASELWSELGGPDIVRTWAAKVGLHDTKPPADPGHWGDTQITAPDMVVLYRYLLEREPTAKRKIILDGMRGATEHGADGFRQYFGIADAAGDDIPWAIKQGWSCCGPERTLHTTGVLGDDDRYIVVVLSTTSKSVDYDNGAKHVTDVVKLLLNK
jgi:hypothetical protein